MAASDLSAVYVVRFTVLVLETSVIMVFGIPVMLILES